MHLNWVKRHFHEYLFRMDTHSVLHTYAVIVVFHIKAHERVKLLKNCKWLVVFPKWKAAICGWNDAFKCPDVSEFGSRNQFGHSAQIYYYFDFYFFSPCVTSLLFCFKTKKNLFLVSSVQMMPSWVSHKVAHGWQWQVTFFGMETGFACALMPF